MFSVRVIKKLHCHATELVRCQYANSTHSLGSTSSASQKRKHMSTVLLSIYQESYHHRKFNTLIADRMFSSYAAALSIWFTVARPCSS